MEKYLSRTPLEAESQPQVRSHPKIHARRWVNSTGIYVIKSLLEPSKEHQIGSQPYNTQSIEHSEMIILDIKSSYFSPSKSPVPITYKAWFGSFTERSIGPAVGHNCVKRRMLNSYEFQKLSSFRESFQAMLKWPNGAQS
jgi:hypothetical protein